MCYKSKFLLHIKNNQGLEGVDSINCNNRLFNLEDLKKAKKKVIKSVQQRHFKEDIVALHNRNSLKSSSKISKLDPFLDPDGILKVGGRIGKCDIPDEIQHPYCWSPEKLLNWSFDSVMSRLQILVRYHNQPNKIFWFLDKMQFIGAISVEKCARCKQLRGQFKQKKDTRFAKR